MTGHAKVGSRYGSVHEKVLWSRWTDRHVPLGWVAHGWVTRMGILLAFRLFSINKGPAQA